MRIEIETMPNGSRLGFLTDHLGVKIVVFENELRELRNAITNALQDHTEVTPEYLAAGATPLNDEDKVELIRLVKKQLNERFGAL